ncbi:MAG: tetratricopeptide repeat protein [Candidatus Latescibacterota bacterium]|nr:tetratricopeptide repeat protein [Candidatus Latescibacterota bacterium]
MQQVCNLGFYLGRRVLFCIFLFISCKEVPERYSLQTVNPKHSLEYFERSDFNELDLLSVSELGWLYIQNNRMRSAVNVYERLTNEDPNNADFYYYFGVALSKEHKKNDAIVAFRRAIDLRPGLAEAYFAKALLLNERGDGFESAIEAVKKGLSVDPQSAYGHFVSGFIFCSRGENDKAQKVLQRAIEIDDSYANAHYYLALIFLRREDDARAIESMEKTIDSNPYYTEAYYSLGTLYARTGRLSDGEKMIGIFQKMSLSDMDEDHYLRLLHRSTDQISLEERVAAHYNLGLVYLRRDDLVAAQSHFNSAYKLDRTYAEAAHNLGVVSSRVGAHNKAVEYYESAVSLRPEYALAYKNLGLSRLSLGLYEQAERAFKQALSLDRELTVAAEGLATALIQQGKVQEGIDIKTGLNNVHK